MALNKTELKNEIATKLEELRKRQEYVKKTTIKREKMKKAKYKQAMINKFVD